MRRTFLSLLVSMFILLLGTSAFAGPATDVVKAKQTELFKLLEAEQNDANKKKIAAIFDEMIDYDTLASESLGAEWKSLKAEQQKEFTGLLKQLVTRAYEKNLRAVLPFNIEYTGEDKADQRVVVKTKAKHKTDARADTIEIDFKLADSGKGKFKIVDIVTDEVSLVESYKAQFVKILKKESYDGLVKRMKEKIAKGQ